MINQLDRIHVDTDGLIHVAGSFAGQYYTTLCEGRVRDETVEWVYQVNERPTTCLRCVANLIQIRKMGQHG